MVAGERSWGGVPGLTPARIMIVAAVFIVGYFAVLVASNAITYYRLAQDEQAVRQEIATLQRRYARLQSLKTYMQTDAFIEAGARENGLVRPGEIAVVQTGPTSAADSLSLNPGDAWWQRYFAPADRR